MEDVQSRGNFDSGAMHQESIQHPQDQSQNIEGFSGNEDYRQEGLQQSEVGESRVSSGQQVPGSYAPSTAGTSVTTGVMDSTYAPSEVGTTQVTQPAM